MIERTLLLCGERVAVAELLQLLPELHDVSSFHKSMTGANRQRTRSHTGQEKRCNIPQMNLRPAERVDDVVEQHLLNGGVLRVGRFEEHGVQHRRAGEQAKRGETIG